MKKTKELENILDDCLERLLVKGETIEQCLQSYPEHAAEIEPLLKTAMATKQALAIQPRPEFKSRARYQFQAALQEVKPKRASPFWGWQPQWVTALAIVLALLLAGGGTVAAAGNSMPDSPLYPVKLASEQVQLKLTASSIRKARLYAKLADRRVAEIAYILDRGEPGRIEATTQRLSRHLVMIAALPLAENGAKRAPSLTVPAPEQIQPELEPRQPPVVLAPLEPQPEEAPGEMPAAEAPPQPGQAEALEPQVRADDTGGDMPVDERGELRILLRRYAANHPAQLRALLERAPESARPALRRAIVASIINYQKALAALD